MLPYVVVALVFLGLAAIVVLVTNFALLYLAWSELRESNTAD